MNNEPPRVIVSYAPAILVSIDGDPVMKPIPNTGFARVINTRVFIARAPGSWFLHVYDGWLVASVLEGPWTLAPSVPAGLDAAAQTLAKSGTVDLLQGPPDAKTKLSLAQGVPEIFVTQTPAELIVFNGQPNLQPITGTGLLWASNTAADVFVNTANNDYYILISGRWYRGPEMDGPWTYVAPDALPADFGKIPVGTPAAVVLASVAGTPQAQEAVIANSIPQTATVKIANGPTFTPAFDGAPLLKPIEGTPLQYVANSPAPIIQVSESSYFALQAGVWFASTTPSGPWIVATAVPPAIYAIPVTSSLHYVTYVRVYGSTPEVVYVGYTPGYLGTVVSADGTVVYGTGYYYSPWVGNYWYPPPVTWGVAAAPVYNPYVGVAFGFAMGAAIGAAAWTPYYGGAFYHPGYWGYPCCGSTSANVYRNWGTGASYGTRSWYADGSQVGTKAYGGYENYRTGTTGAYAGGRSYNYDTGVAKEGYARTFNTPGGVSGSVDRGQAYNTNTGQRYYASGATATGPGGSSVTRDATATAGPEGVARSSSTTAYDAKTGQTKTWSDGRPANDTYAGSDGNVYRSSESGWQQHTSSGWQSAAPATRRGPTRSSRPAAPARTASTAAAGVIVPAAGGVAAAGVAVIASAAVEAGVTASAEEATATASADSEDSAGAVSGVSRPQSIPLVVLTGLEPCSRAVSASWRSPSLPITSSSAASNAASNWCSCCGRKLPRRLCARPRQLLFFIRRSAPVCRIE